jgi:adenylate cyclase
MTAATTRICKGCWQQMHVPIFIRGPLSFPFRMAGIKISRMNPNLCTICETMFTKVKHRKQIVVPATVMFADLRGYTTLSESAKADEVVEMLNGFYDDCAAAIWERDGIVNKFIGDAVLAVFNFPIERKDHELQAALAATNIQQRCAERNRLLVEHADASHPVEVGIGIHAGEASIGEVGTAYRDFTIIGPVVNAANRMQGAAKAGEILVTEAVYAKVKDVFPRAEHRVVALKGLEQPVTGYSLRAH